MPETAVLLTPIHFVYLVGVIAILSVNDPAGLRLRRYVSCFFLDGILDWDRKRRNTDCFFSDYLCSQRVYGGNCNDCPGRCFVQMSDGFGKQQTFDGAYGRDYEDTNNGLVGSGTSMFLFSLFYGLRRLWRW